MRALPLSLLLAAAAALVPPLEAGAQEDPPLALDLRSESGTVRVVLGEVLEGRGVRSALESGLPVRLYLVTELWRDRLLDAQEGRHEWRATIRFDPLSELYRVETGEGPLGVVATVGEALELLRRDVEVPLRPRRSGRYYYLARLAVETLSLSDLEELREWLRGDVGPAVEGREEVGGALLQGLRRLFARGLGLPVHRYQARTARFQWEG